MININLKKILATIKINKFSYKNKIGKLKFNDINNLINNIKNNTISEAFAKRKLNALNKIKKAETKNKRLINGQKILLNLFDDLVKAIFNNKIMSEDNNIIVSQDNNKTVSENNNTTLSENNNKILIEHNNMGDDNNNNNNNDDDDDDHDYEIKQINNCLKMIDKTKSFRSK